MKVVVQLLLVFENKSDCSVPNSHSASFQNDQAVCRNHCRVFCWSDVDCGALEELEHGSVRLTDARTTYGATATYSCHTNYTLTGNNQRSCGENSTWTGTTPQCLCE